MAGIPDLKDSLGVYVYWKGVNEEETTVLMLSSLKGEQGHHLKPAAQQDREYCVLNQEPKKQRLQLLLELCHCPKSHWPQLTHCLPGAPSSASPRPLLCCVVTHI